MNKLMTSKKLLAKDTSRSTLCNKIRKRDRNNESAVISKKYRETKTVKNKIKNAVKQKALQESDENELSNKNLGEIRTVNARSPSSPRKLESDESVVYISTTLQSELNGTSPLVDLTNTISEESLHKELPSNSKQLKTIFFPTRNFERDTRLRKSLATTSLITLPVIKKIVPKKLNSATVIGKYTNRLSVLDIPSHFLEWEDLNYNEMDVLEKCELTKSDHELIQWILERENENFELNVTFTSSSSGYNSSLDTVVSMEDMINLYDVSSRDCV